MPTADASAFVRASLPPAPARVLEVGAGDGELAALLAATGYDVLAIDPAADAGSAHVEPIALLDVGAPDASFDAAVAMLSLHHLEPLGASCERLAALIRPGGRLVIDEIDFELLDERAAGWWIEQRAAAGREHPHDAATMVAELDEHLHSLRAVRAALAPHFALGEPVRGAYLHRWGIDAGLRGAEEELIATGRMPAVGARMVGVRAD
jgi:SAM-dependent methyltransferase